MIRTLYIFAVAALRECGFRHLRPLSTRLADAGEIAATLGDHPSG